MTTYYCKCGKTFSKNTMASTTGNRMPDYGPQHECWGCPYVNEIKTWDPLSQVSAVTNYECRGSKILLYHTTADLSLGDKRVGSIYSLDLEFLHTVREYADSLEGIEPDRYAFSGRAAEYCSDGRFRLTIYPDQNNKGAQAKQQLFDHFFNPDGSRQDISPDDEKVLVLDTIQKSKEAAQSMSNNKTTPHTYRYTSGNYSAIYKVAQKENGKFGAQIIGSDSEKIQWSGTVSEQDTFEEAQRALDSYAEKMSVLHLIEENNSEPEQTEFINIEPYGSCAESESTESGETVPNDDQSSDVPDSDDNSLEDNPGEPDIPVSIDDRPEDGYEGEPDPEPEPDDGQLPDGPDLSLRLPAFDAMFSTADGALRDMARTLKTKYIESGELNIKIAINNYSGVLKPDLKKSKVDCALKPAKVSVPISFSNDVEFVVDDDGRVILPDDRERQMSFDDLQNNDVTTIVDGSTSLVEDVDTNDEPETEDTSDVPTEVDDNDSSETPGENPDPGLYEYKCQVDDCEPLYPCENIDCPFWGLDDIENTGACCYYSDNNPMDADYLADVSAAATEYGCTRDEVIQKNNEIVEGNDAE